MKAEAPAVMQWDDGAISALKRLQLIHQDAVTREAEMRATARDEDTVTAADVENAAKNMAPARPPVPSHQSHVCVNGSLTGEAPVEHINRLESFSYEQGTIETDYTVIRVCSASVGCPKRVMELTSLRDKIMAKIESSGLKQFLCRDTQGVIPFHQRFRLGISGCPNACSQPQISDFGVIARAMPESLSAECIECGRCVSACLENSIQVLDHEAVIDYIKCVGCSDCARACPTGTLRADRKGFGVKIGGRLGRHPQLAQEIVHLATEDEVILALDASLTLYMEHGQAGERFSYAVNRLGMKAFIETVGSALAKHRQRFRAAKKKVYHAL